MTNPNPDRLEDLRAEYAQTGMVTSDGAVWLFSQVVVLREQVQRLSASAAVSVPPPAPRADALREAADFLRDAHFRDGLSVQEIGTAMRHWADREEQPSAGEQQNETPEAEAPVVAYRSRDSRSLYCTAHAGELFGLSYEPVTAEDLPDGGICMYPDCGRDVLAGPRP